MFGYIAPSLTGLSEEDQARYKALYCGICRSLAAQTGQRSRVVLSYDMLLLALILGSLYEPQESRDTKTCLVHPIEAKDYIASATLDYAADMTVLLAYYKCQDDWADDHSVKARALGSLLKKPYETVATRWPRQCETASRCMLEIAQTERQAPDALDQAGNWFGALMGDLFVWRQDFFSDDLRRFGARLGKFIYAMDAACDLDEDLKTGSYNPFAKLDFDQALILEYLQMLAGQMTEVFERLPLERDMTIMRNILYSGMWQKYRRKYAADADDIQEEEVARGDGSL